MKTIKNIETSEVKEKEISSIKKQKKKEEKTNLKTFHFPKQGKIIKAKSYEEALKKL